MLKSGVFEVDQRLQRVDLPARSIEGITPPGADPTRAAHRVFRIPQQRACGPEEGGSASSAEASQVWRATALLWHVRVMVYTSCSSIEAPQ
jgi:hypothetical protein